MHLSTCAHTGLFCPSAKFTLRISLTAPLLLGAVLLLTGCGATSGSGSYSAPSITVQPVSQTVPIGQTATFTVTATGAAPLNYQWSEDGVEIAGATSASYTTPAITLGASGSALIGTFQVTVSNSSGSVASNAVTLTAAPRSPKQGDLRYLLSQQVDVPGLGEYGGMVSNILPESYAWFDNAIGTPLALGSTAVCYPGIEYDCAWPFSVSNLPPPMTGLDMFYKGGTYPNFASDMQSIVAPNVVLTSLDFEPANGAYAVSWVETAQAGGFDYRLEVVPQAQIQATSTQDGAESRVITAVSFDASGQANLISYGWQGDTTTVYETQAIVAAPDALASAATSLAGEGYIISAFGGNDPVGYMLIGTRVAGDSLPRPITVITPSGTTPATNPDSAYFTTVIYFDENGYLLVSEQ